MTQQKNIARLTLCWLVIALVGCGGSGDLSPDAVRSIPAGTATGADHAGSYSIELRVVDCRGSCGPFTVGIFSASVCDVGDVETDIVEVEQVDGRLVIDTGELPSRFEGGIDQSGAFDVGGFATQFGGELEISARAEGTFTAGTLEGTVRALSRGEVEGQSADCVGIREVTGTRL